ncbi:hypothetical protein AAJCM20276_37830 (plasmid) [Acetobacter aceti]|uniref:Uncharacterized protein n=1 Tax=Acetobacter aceti TaxID=435 RepID=A0A6S6PNV3_ACEAC|nr:hypothetical protein [Acetobacter aceti]BCI69159.1 hypothetical protein AAJCM20276_37830 [Acetobacter aceti]
MRRCQRCNGDVIFARPEGWKPVEQLTGVTLTSAATIGGRRRFTCRRFRLALGIRATTNVRNFYEVFAVYVGGVLDRLQRHRRRDVLAWLRVWAFFRAAW